MKFKSQNFLIKLPLYVVVQKNFEFLNEAKPSKIIDESTKIFLGIIKKMR